MKPRIWLLCLPIAAGAALFAPSTSDGWSSACGCLNDDAEFAYFVTGNESFDISTAHVNLDTQLNEAMVASGFLAKIPAGSPFEVIDAKRSFMKNSCTHESVSLYRCDYWLQFNKTSERGYAVFFNLSDKKRLISIEAKKIIRARQKNAV